MKENLKIRVNLSEKKEAFDLCESLKLDCIEFCESHVCAYKSKTTQHCTELNMDELRELARPKEYLNDKFELVVTNQPEDGYRLVPDGSEYLTESGNVFLFWKSDKLHAHRGTRSWYQGIFSIETYLRDCSRSSIIWQRTPQQETIMEKKGRFLHQEWMDKHIEGVLIQSKLNRQPDFCDIDDDYSFAYFNDTSREFRLKPKTIQIGERTIVKPIDVKPEMGDIVYVANLTDIDLVTEQKWKNTVLHIHFFDLGLLHKSKEDAIAHCEALLELMK